ncbi:MAG: gamma-glutamyl-gamma-aminobutyrate hydrolase family protein [Candidatus Diapherotrites archaeon]|nr:gamma-glutamyl-gamma-aminobutyrate hydrolase family protein [Candidatus Diapherotrites archaeon]
MICLISQRRNQNRYGAYLDALETSYVTFFEGLGVSLVPVSNESVRVRKMFDEFKAHGVILTGGENVDSKVFGEPPINPAGIAVERDAVEKILVGEAMKRKLPVLGICRGLQFLNVHFGGRLSQSVKEEFGGHAGTQHEIMVVDAGFEKYLGRKTLRVNSFHNQGVPEKLLSKELRAFAMTENGLVEGFYHPAKAVLAVQWHPERKSPDVEANEKIAGIFLEKKFFWLDRK